MRIRIIRLGWLEFKTKGRFSWTMSLGSIILVISFWLISGCYTEDDADLNKACTSDCTEIRGRISSDGGKQPIANLQLELEWNLHYNSLAPPFGGGFKRKIASTTTDSNGSYSFRFFATERELSEDGAYLISFNKPSDEFLYAVPIYVDDLRERGAEITVDYLLPRTANIRVIISNPGALMPGDLFRVSVSTNYGPSLFPEPWRTGCSFFSGETDPKTLQTAANQPSYLVFSKIKGGVETLVADTVSVPAGTEYTMAIDF